MVVVWWLWWSLFWFGLCYELFLCLFFYVVVVFDFVVLCCFDGYIYFWYCGCICCCCVYIFGVICLFVCILYVVVAIVMYSVH